MTVLDVDTLAKAENVTWSWGGADCFDPEERLCMVSLSRGGSDANEAREFDLKTGQFVKDGFRPRRRKCLSFPSIVEEITRAGHVKVRALDADGTPFELEADELLAVAIQHELDHLDGILMIDHGHPQETHRRPQDAQTAPSIARARRRSSFNTASSRRRRDHGRSLRGAST